MNPTLECRWCYQEDGHVPGVAFWSLIMHTVSQFLTLWTEDNSVKECTANSMESIVCCNERNSPYCAQSSFFIDAIHHHRQCSRAFCLNFHVSDHLIDCDRFAAYYSPFPNGYSCGDTVDMYDYCTFEVSKTETVADQ